METQLLLSKIGIYDCEPNRQSAVRRMLKSQEKIIWFLDDAGLTYMYRNGEMRQSLSKSWPKTMPLDVVMAVESGFDINKTPSASFNFASLCITRHALARWNERCQGLMPVLEEINQRMNDHSSNKVINGQRPTGEFFLPLSAGALVGIHQNQPLRYESISEVKNRSLQGNYQWNKEKRRWVGEFPRMELKSIATTFLGWEELKRGGIYNALDWQETLKTNSQSNQQLINIIEEMIDA